MLCDHVVCPGADNTNVFHKMKVNVCRDPRICGHFLTESSSIRYDAAHVHSMSFRLARPGRRGLDEDNVRDFCTRAGDELARLLEKRASRYAEVRRPRGRAQARNRAGTGPAMPLSAPVAASSPGASARAAGWLARPGEPSGSAAGPSGSSGSAGPSESGGPAGAGPQESDVQAVRILAKARQTGERCVAAAQPYSARQPTTTSGAANGSWPGRAPALPGVPGRAGSRGSGSDARKRVRNINRSGFTLPTHPGTTPETPTAESTCQESERVVV